MRSGGYERFACPAAQAKALRRGTQNTGPVVEAPVLVHDSDRAEKPSPRVSASTGVAPMKDLFSRLRAKAVLCQRLPLVRPASKSPAEYQSVIDALVDDGRVDDACWLLDQFGPIQSVLVVDAISAHALPMQGSVQVRGGWMSTRLHGAR